jgi:hypothetical protein
MMGTLTVLPSLLCAGCSIRAFHPESEATPANYYLDNKKKIVKDVQQITPHMEKICDDRYGKQAAEIIIRQTLSGFDSLLTDLPYIGGDSNELTANLYQAAASLAFYQGMLTHEKTLEETGEILYRSIEAWMAAIPMNALSGRVSASKNSLDDMKAGAEESQKRTYPEDWVYSFVEGDGKNFDYGIDYTECGICKYLKSKKAEELTPYLCLLDFPISQAMNTGLIRTTTLARGDRCCDFRYHMGAACRMEWQPDFLKKEE